MIVYVWKQSIEINNHYLFHRVSDEMKDLWIEWLLPVFHDEEKAKKFCWEDNYLLLSTQNK